MGGNKHTGCWAANDNRYIFYIDTIIHYCKRSCEKMKHSFYFCSIEEDNKKCAKMEECRRYTDIKDIPFKERQNFGTAKLYNICNEENNFKMILRQKEIQHD